MQYSTNSIISRVSGVKFSDEQNFDEMIKLWNGLVDQVAFVEYNPWENSYNKPTNNIVCIERFNSISGCFINLLTLAT